MRVGVSVGGGLDTDPYADTPLSLTPQVRGLTRVPGRGQTDPLWGLSYGEVNEYMADDNALLKAQASLTKRDLVLIGWLHDHGVLTTYQIADALFPSLDFAQRRLLKLTRLGILTRFRPQKWDGGSHPYHYVLDQLGAEAAAAEGGDDPPRRDQARRRRNHLVSRANLRTCSAPTSSSSTWPRTGAPTRAVPYSGGGRRRRSRRAEPSTAATTTHCSSPPGSFPAPTGTASGPTTAPRCRSSPNSIPEVSAWKS